MTITTSLIKSIQTAHIIAGTYRHKLMHLGTLPYLQQQQSS